ncbi:hypothetical protein DICSQDRAFT_133595 [Dichomitus squalens LYAD-421 SS1]|uniref:Uncharacterized protein n=1 Tax=Dichomitus squalens TaxID=114155 RepID=A0A4Q9Q824_9APHY|nr:uncharacterized protein DICSQDRAFT_133595 [Dichomitus squalens LYAD-421 SS1]EJF64883.1 hypothetical protein DICSQDRAFT_133595 [Dichomitus squalens LYAD-421 SS1]TBU62754.1 hypothetical protein BD310DRAFT_945625 [Dichomitus squalens]
MPIQEPQAQRRAVANVHRAKMTVGNANASARMSRAQPRLKPTQLARHWPARGQIPPHTAQRKARR